MIRKLIRIIVLPMVIAFITVGFAKSKDTVDFSQYLVETNDVCFYVPTLEEQRSFDRPQFAQLPLIGKSFIGFREALGFKESQGNYFVVNQFGYLGKYQFGKSTLKLIGIPNAAKFLATPELQEEAFTAYAARNKWVLRRDIRRYVGRTINGIKITESGILAAAHLAGPGNVKQYLRSGGSLEFNDAFGTTVGYYMRKFAGYDTSCVVADKKAKV
ncbi:MAG: peptidoglycan-binding protein LysM [Gilvibacter sp.]